VQNAEGTTRTYTVAGSGQTLDDKLRNPQTTSAIFWQWQRQAPGAGTWVDIAGANGTSYTTPAFLPADHGVKYRVLAAIPGLTTPSVESTVSVVEDVTSPTIVGVSAMPFVDGVQNRVGVHFSEPVRANELTSLANYSLTIQGGAAVGISTATSINNNSAVILTTTENLTPGTVYEVTVSSIHDPSVANNLLAPDPTTTAFTAWTQTLGYVRRERYNGGDGGKVATLTGLANYPNSPNQVDFRNVMETPTNIADQFGQRLTGYLTPTETANYFFAIAADDQSVLYLSTDEDPANKVLIVTEPEWGGVRDWNGTDRRIAAGGDDFFRNITTLPVNRSQNTVGAKNLTVGMKYYFEVLTREGGGGDNCAVTWWKEGENMPGNGSSPISGSVVTGWTNPDNTINITAQPPNRVVDTGANTTFTVTASATTRFAPGVLYYQWRKGGVNLSNGGDISGATSATLTINNVDASDVDSYDVVIRTAGAPNATSNPGTLSLTAVNPTLSIVKNGNNAVVTYATSAQAAGHQLQKATSLAGPPVAFADDATGSDVAGTWTTTVDLTTTPDDESYWRTRHP
jgi:hypothetical protein